MKRDPESQQPVLIVMDSPMHPDTARVLVVQRTGWGKSLVYWIATKVRRDAGHGPTLIISPLLALMRNQIEDDDRGIDVFIDRYVARPNCARNPKALSLEDIPEQAEEIRIIRNHKHARHVPP